MRDHRRERRAQVVRDVGEKLGFERVLVAELGDGASQPGVLLSQAPELSLEGGGIRVGARHTVSVRSRLNARQWTENSRSRTVIYITLYGRPRPADRLDRRLLNSPYAV